MCESADGKLDREEHEQLAKTLDYSFLVDQSGLEDLEKLWLRAPPFDTSDDSLDRQERTTNLLHFPNCPSGERKRPLRLVVEAGLSRLNSCYFLRSSTLWTVPSRCHELFRVAGWRWDVSIYVQGQLLPSLKRQVANNLQENRDVVQMRTALSRYHEYFRVVD